MLEPKIFDYVIHQFGRPEIGMFASRLTKQILIYIYWLPDPESSVIDAFTIHWNNILIYAFPPFSIIWRMMKNPGGMQESNSNSSALDNPNVVCKDHGTCNLTTYNHPQSIPQTSQNQSETSTLSETSDVGLGLLILNQFHLQHQFFRCTSNYISSMEEQYQNKIQQYIQKMNSIHCKQIQ